MNEGFHFCFLQSFTKPKPSFSLRSFFVYSYFRSVFPVYVAHLVSANFSPLIPQINTLLFRHFASTSAHNVFSLAVSHSALNSDPLSQVSVGKSHKQAAMSNSFSFFFSQFSIIDTFA